MPVTIPNNLPAIDILRKENIFVISQLRAKAQDIRPLKVLILNLMPVKETTETDFIRVLSNNALQIEIEFVRLETHNSKNTSEEHLNAFYKKFGEVKDDYYDGMIVTGAPVENYDFEDVTYWGEMTSILDWARVHVTSTLYICWAAQAAMYHFYSVPKYPLQDKMFGVFKHTLTNRKYPLTRGFDDEFYIPQSRHTEVRREDILKCAGLTIIAESGESGVGIVASRGGREFYLTGHSEYSRNTLNGEYVRDQEKELPINVPQNYYKDDNPANTPLVHWASHSNLLFNNWLNYYVYQETPYDRSKIKNLTSIEPAGDEYMYYI